MRWVQVGVHLAAAPAAPAQPEGQARPGPTFGQPKLWTCARRDGLEATAPGTCSDKGAARWVGSAPAWEVWDSYVKAHACAHHRNDTYTSLHFSPGWLVYLLVSVCAAECGQPVSPSCKLCNASHAGQGQFPLPNSCSAPGQGQARLVTASQLHFYQMGAICSGRQHMHMWTVLMAKPQKSVQCLQSRPGDEDTTGVTVIPTATLIVTPINWPIFKAPHLQLAALRFGRHPGLEGHWRALIPTGPGFVALRLEGCAPTQAGTLGVSPP